MDTADGTVMIVAARDMTRHRREEADRYRMDLMAGVVEYADDATLTSWNAAAEKTVGYSSQEIIGR
jgi:PAS domain-containing protein